MKRLAWASLALAASALVVAASLPRGCAPAQRAERAQRARASVQVGEFAFSPVTRLLEIGAREASLLLWVDEAPHLLSAHGLVPEPLADGGVVFSPTVNLGDESLPLRLELHARGAALVISLQSARMSNTAHSVRLRVEWADANDVFAAGLGDVADLGRLVAPIVQWSNAEQTFAATTRAGSLTFERFTYPGANFDNVGLAVESPELDTLHAEGAPAVELALTAGDAAAVSERIFTLRGESPLPLHGVVRGAREGAAVYATDAQGVPWARVPVRQAEDGGASWTFSLFAPAWLTHYFAANRRERGTTHEAAGTSLTTTFEPGQPWPLLLDLEPPGSCIVHVVDGDSGRPLTSRILVRGAEGTRDPWFGPDYRASGAGPLLDARDGAAELELPSGRYRVQATHGPFYSIDEASLDIAPGGHAEVTLRPRRVVPALGSISADLHVHARPSYDSPVQPEDRVLSLVAAGVEFAVPTEHNVVGDYADALSTTGQGDMLRFVTGVEVTTFAPRLGHFGVFPYPVDKKVPPYRGTNLASLFAFVRQDPSRVLVVHHPFLGHGMGYFDRFAGVAPERGAFGGARLDFDAIEVLNGYETLDDARTEQTVRSWLGLLAAGHPAVGVGSSDSHRILYGWAGYPRTLIRVANEGGEVAPASLDVDATLRALRAGKVQATTGPVLALEVDGKQVGETRALAAGKKMRVHLEVYAAPWIDVTHVDLYLGQHVALSLPVDPVPLRVGPEPGDPPERFARALRLVRDLELDTPAGPSFVVAVARGDKKLEWVLPATALPPLAITNPVWLK